VLALYAVTAIVVFLVVLWLVRRLPRQAEAVVPRSWRWSGFLVWASLLMGGFTGVSAMISPALHGLPDAVAAVLGGAIFGAVVALVIWIGSSLALYAEPRAWRWAVLYQVVALAGDLFASAGSGGVSFLIVSVIPAAGLIALALAFRNPPVPAARA
jgi:hypothetical protein